MGYRLGVDSGGTHTDAVLFDEERGQRWVEKVPSTPHNPVEAILEGLELACGAGGAAPADVGRFVYGTSLIVNAILEGDTRALHCGLITTAGFEDVLELAKSYRVGNIYDLQWTPPPPLIRRDLRLGVRERIDAGGEVVVPLDEESVRDAVRALAGRGVESIAVCLLHSYANSAHERRVAAVVEELAPGVTVSLSSVVCPIIGEYERTSTTVIDAFIKPRVVEHLARAERDVRRRGVPGALLTMQANGGTTTLPAAKRRPVLIAKSGLVAGVVAGVASARALGYEQAITLDVGGTSTDAALVADGRPRTAYSDELMGHALQLPTVEVDTIGAGGGSIARADGDGSVRVGPDSAGAVPGPACYGAGGVEATVTDAAVVTGRLNPAFFLGGRRALDVEAATRVVRERLARPLGLEPDAAGAGAIAIAVANTVRAIHRLSIARGHDTRAFPLIAFGGAGGLVGSMVARELEIPAVVIPPDPGNASALGLLLTDERYDFSVSRLSVLDELRAGELEAAFAALERTAAEELERERAAAPDRLIARSADLRYLGQSFDLNVSAPARFASDADVAGLARSFHERYEETYGRSAEGDPVQVVNLHVTVIGQTPRPRFAPLRAGGEDPSSALSGQRSVYFDEPLTTAVYERSRLAAGNAVEGPAVIEEPGATALVWPGELARVDHTGHLVIARGGLDG